MSYIEPKSRKQMMIPSSIDDYVSPESPVRVIDAFVDKLVQNNPELNSDKGTNLVGRSAYKYSTLLKLYIYGFINSVNSSRKLERETYRNMEVIWLLGDLKPDHKTISDFRKDNKENIRKSTILFRKFLIKEGYIEGKMLITDGTKIKANASRDSLSIEIIDRRMRRLEEELENYFNQLQNADAVDSLEEEITTLSKDSGIDKALLEKIAYLQAKIEELESYKRKIEENEQKSISLTDPDAKLMRSKQGFFPGYNIQSTVDSKNKMIIQLDVTDRQNDFNTLEENVESVKNELDIIPETVLADKGFANEDQIRSLEEQGINCVVPFYEMGKEKNKRQLDNGITFTYNEDEDCFYCSQGKKLTLMKKPFKERGKLYKKYQGKNCDQCSLKSVCTKSKKGRILSIRVEDEWLKKYKNKLKLAEYKELISDRKKYVEHPFGTIKYWMGKMPLLLRGKEKVQAEIDLYATCYNIKRLLNIEPMEVILGKIANWG